MLETRMGGFFVDSPLFIHLLIYFPPVSLASTGGNWHSHMSGSGMSEYDMPMHAPQTYTHGTAHYSHSAHSR